MPHVCTDRHYTQHVHDFWCTTTAVQPDTNDPAREMLNSLLLDKQRLRMQYTADVCTVQKVACSHSQWVSTALLEGRQAKPTFEPNSVTQ